MEFDPLFDRFRGYFGNLMASVGIKSKKLTDFGLFGIN